MYLKQIIYEKEIGVLGSLDCQGYQFEIILLSPELVHNTEGGGAEGHLVGFEQADFALLAQHPHKLSYRGTLTEEQ